LSSERSPGNRAPRARVIKSAHVSQAPFTFPPLEQAAFGDLRPGASPDDAHDREGLQRTLEETREALQLLEQARAVEARARAMERRAMAVLEEAEETGGTRLTEAEAQALDLITRAGEGAEAIQAEAQASGFALGQAEGYEAGLAGGRAEAEALLAEARAEVALIIAAAQHSAETVRQEALEQRSLLLDASSEQLHDLAMAMARQVLKAELTIRPEAFVPMLEAALAKLKGEEEPQIRVSVEALAVLEEHRGRLLAAVPGTRKLDVDGDPALGPGDFVVQGSQGFVNGRLESQLDVLATKIRTEEQ
jgi:flagellar assembly protein FliH